MVKTTPIEALKVRNMLIRTPPAATSAPPERKREGRGLAHVDGDELGRDRIDRDRPDGGADPGARQREIEQPRRSPANASAIRRFAATVLPSTVNGIDR